MCWTIPKTITEQRLRCPPACRTVVVSQIRSTRSFTTVRTAMHRRARSTCRIAGLNWASRPAMIIWIPMTIPTLLRWRTPMMNDPDRRLVLGGGLAACLVATAPMPVLALTDAGARQLVDRVVADINKVIASGKPLSSMIRDFERIFSRYADVNIIARTYGKRFQEFSGGRVEVQSVRKTKSWHEVKSQVILRGQSPFEVLFLVSDRSGRDLFFDMIIEGVSLRLSERTEIGAMLDRRKGNIDALIADLKQAG